MRLILNILFLGTIFFGINSFGSNGRNDRLEASQLDCAVLMRLENPHPLDHQGLSDLLASHHADQESLRIKKAAQIDPGPRFEKLKTQISELESRIGLAEDQLLENIIGFTMKTSGGQEVLLKSNRDDLEIAISSDVYEKVKQFALNGDFSAAQTEYHREISSKKARAVREVLGYIVLGLRESYVVLKPVQGGVAFSIPRSIFELVLSELISNKGAEAVRIFSLAFEKVGSKKPDAQASKPSRSDRASEPLIVKDYSPILNSSAGSATEAEITSVVEEIAKDSEKIKSYGTFLASNPPETAPLPNPPNDSSFVPLGNSDYSSRFKKPEDGPVRFPGGWTLYYEYGPEVKFIENRLVCEKCVHERDRYRVIVHKLPKYLVFYRATRDHNSKIHEDKSALVQIEPQTYFSNLYGYQTDSSEATWSGRYDVGERLRKVFDFFELKFQAQSTIGSAVTETLRLRESVAKARSDLIQMALGYMIQSESEDSIILKNAKTQFEVSIHKESFSKVEELVLRKRAYLAREEFNRIVAGIESRVIQENLGCVVVGETHDSVVLQMAGYQDQLLYSKKIFAAVITGLFTNHIAQSKKLFIDILKEVTQ